jgi:hypothetical protein
MSFASLYQFPLLSTQQQGVELYTLFRQNMDIDELYEDVSNEIDAWDRVMAQHNEESVNTRVTAITIIGLPIAIITLFLTGLTSWLGLPFGNVKIWDRMFSWFCMANHIGSMLPALLAAALFVAIGGLVLIGLKIWFGKRFENIRHWFKLQLQDVGSWLGR